MSSAYITVRNTKSGKRYVVRYRLGGRMHKIIHAGSFPTQREARDRRDLVAGELAAGRDPMVLLNALKTTEPRRTLAQWFDAFVDSRIDVSDRTIGNYKSHRPRIVKTLGPRDPFTLTAADAREWVAQNADMAATSVRAYYQTFQLVLDHAGVTPNPFRDKTVKLPRRERDEIVPPSAEHVLAILERVTDRWRLGLILIEQTGIRVGEAASLVWGDVDVPGARLRLRAAASKSRKTRSARVPRWLMAHIEETCAAEDRTATRRVFPGFTEDGALNAMARACKTAEIPHYTPHKLRHRRATLWHHEGVPTRELQERIGHSSALLTLDWYTHAMPLDEVTIGSYERVLVRSR